jgi:urease accessory protein
MSFSTNQNASSISNGSPVGTPLRIEKLVGNNNAVKAAASTTLELPFDRRQVSRQLVTLGNGREAGLFLPRGTVLRGGDVLEAEDSSTVHVLASQEAVLLVKATDTITLMRATYHLGNRHVPVEIGDGYLKLEYDYVLQEMLLRLGVTVLEQMASFEPEAGAYGGGHRHSHD